MRIGPWPVKVAETSGAGMARERDDGPWASSNFSRVVHEGLRQLVTACSLAHFVRPTGLPGSGIAYLFIQGMERRSPTLKTKE